MQLCSESRLEPSPDGAKRKPIPQSINILCYSFQPPAKTIWESCMPFSYQLRWINIKVNFCTTKYWSPRQTVYFGSFRAWMMSYILWLAQRRRALISSNNYWAVEFQKMKRSQLCLVATTLFCSGWLQFTIRITVFILWHKFGKPPQNMSCRRLEISD